MEDGSGWALHPQPPRSTGIGPEFHGFCPFPSGHFWAGLFFPLFFSVFEIRHLLVLKPDFSFHRNLKSDIMKYVCFQISDRGDVRFHKKGKLKKHSWGIFGDSSFTLVQWWRASLKNLLSTGHQFDSGRKHVNSDSHGFEQIDPKESFLNYWFQ